MEARLKGLSFCQLEDLDLRTTCDKIILKVAAINGSPTPETDFFADVLTQELTGFMNEFEFKNLTYAEIVLALRLNAKGGLRTPTNHEYMEKVNFTGTCFNVYFISAVLTNYMMFRDGLDRKIQNQIDGY